MKLEEFRPANNWVLIRLNPESRETEGGIYLPDSATLVSYQEGVIVAGPRYSSYEQGTRVLFTRAAGRDIVFDGQDKSDEYQLVDVEDLVGYANG